MNTSRNSSVKRKRASNSSQAGMYSEGTKVAFQFEYFFFNRQAQSAFC